MNFINPLLYEYDPTIGNDTLCANCGRSYGAHHGMVCHPGNKHSSLFAQIPKQEETAVAVVRKELEDAVYNHLAESLYGRAITAVVHDEVQEAEQQAQPAHDHSDAAFEEKMRQYLDARGLTVVNKVDVEDGNVLTHDPVTGVIGAGTPEAEGPLGLTVVAGFGSHRMGMNAWQGKD